MKDIWMKEIDISDGQEFCDLLIELANYENVYARPVPQDFTYDDFASFKQTRMYLATGENIPDGYIQTSTYWVMNGNEPVGYATLKHAADFSKPGGHFGCCLKRSVQNMGVGTIVSNLLSEIAYNKLGIEHVIYTAKDENVQSQKSLEHIGARLVNIQNGYHFYVVDLSKKYEERRMK